MIFSNQTPWPASWTMGFDRSGRELLVVIVKSTYTMPANGESPRPADEQVPLVEADRFSGEPGLSAPLFDTDFAHHKPGCDVLLVGQAHAPAGLEVTHLDVGLQVGSLSKRLRVVGPRHWRKGLVGVSASEPRHFTALPISYDHAFGGTDRTREGDGHTDTYLPNPVGRGYRAHLDGIDGQPLPHCEEPGRPVDRPDGAYRPMALSPLGRNWQERARFAGTYDQAWVESVAPLWPADFDDRYFQAAPADQIIPYPRGGEVVELRHLTDDGLRRFTLPRTQVPLTFIPHRGQDLTVLTNIDTVVLEPDAGRFTLTHRFSLPLGRSIFDVQEVLVGERPHAWHRARRFPGKTFYEGLGALVAARHRAS